MASPRVGVARAALSVLTATAITGSLILVGAGPAWADPVPTVAATSATTTATAAAVLAPVVTGTGIDHSLTCLVDGSGCVTTLSVPGEGSWTVNPATGAVTFTAVAGFAGTTPTRAYRVTDAAAQTGEGPLTVTVNAPSVPTVTAKVATASGTTATTVTPTVSPTTFLVNGSTCVVDPADSACKATVAIAGTGTFTVNTSTRAAAFTAAAGFTGAVPAVTYRVTDSYGQSGSGTITVTVTAPSAPVVTPRVVTVTGSTATAVTPTVSPTTFLVSSSTCVIDPADSVCKTTVPITGTGTFVVNTSTRALTFTAVAGFTGAVPAVGYQVTDTYGRTASGTVTVTVALPAVPAVTPRVVSVNQTTATTVTPTVAPTAFLVAASTCVIDPADSVCKTTVPITGTGTFVVNTSTRALTFTAVAGFSGAVPAVAYRVTDTYGQTGSGTVTVTVNAPAVPVVTPRIVSTNAAAATTVTPTVAPTTFLVAASTCVIDPADSVCKTTVPITGTGTFVVNTSTRALTFTAAAGFSGAVPAVTYRVTDTYGQSGSGTVTVTVNAPAAPVVTTATGTTSGTTAVAITPTVTPSTYVVNASTCIMAPACVTTLAVPGEGTWTITLSNRRITFTPTVGFTGATTPVTYRVADTYAQSGTGTVTVTVNAPAAPAVTVTSTTTAYNTAKTFTPTVTPSTFLVNASTCVVDPADAMCKTTVNVAGQGRWAVNTSTRALTFTPLSTFSGATTAITYRVTNSYGSTSSGTSNVVVTVSAPTGPVVTALSSSTAFGVAKTVTPTATGTGIVNASACVVDPADSTCRTAVTVAGQGTWSINTSTRAVTFTPSGTFAGAAMQTYRVSDVVGQSGSNTVTVTVGNPAAPTVAAATGSTSGTTSVTLTPTVTGTDIDPALACLVDGAACVASRTVSGQGTWVVSSTTGTVTFTAVAGFVGTTTAVSYRAGDGYGQTGTGAVTATVAAPAAPAVAATTAATTSVAAVVISPLITGTGVDPALACLVDGASCVTSKSVSGQGTWAVKASTGAVTFTPVASFTGVATTMTYRATDAYGHTGTGSITVTVTPASVPVDDSTGTPAVEPSPTPTPTPSPTPATEAPAKPVELPVTRFLVTSVGESVQSAPMAGVAPPAGEKWDLSSMRLVDPSDAALLDRVVTTQGTWLVDPETGIVRFVPAKDFVGSTQIEFRIWTVPAGSRSGARSAIRDDLAAIDTTVRGAGFTSFVTATVKKAVMVQPKTSVYFTALSASLSAKAKAAIDALVRNAEAIGTIRQSLVIGYVQPNHYTANDMSLSKRRALAVKRYLQSKGVEVAVTAVGAGQAAQHTADGRRATITLLVARRAAASS